MSSRAVELKDLLVAAGVGVFNVTDTANVTDWSISVGKMAEKPDRCITAYDSGGKSPNPAWLVDYPTVQIKVRGSENDYVAAVDKTTEVKDALLGIMSQTIGSDIYVSISMIGDRNFLGYDENGRPMFSLNFQLIINPSTGTHRKSL